MNAEDARRIFDYSIVSGKLFWRNQPSSKVPAGSIAGTLTKQGYVSLKYQGKRHLVHRIAWLYVTGEPASGQVDHRDGRRSNNSWINLRDCTQSVNQQNMRRPKSSNALGLLGVHIDKASGKPRADISVNGKNLYLGLFETPEEAHAAYIEAKRKHHDGCTI